MFANRLYENLYGPIVKNKTGDTNKVRKTSYKHRTTASSKLFTIYFLGILVTYLITHDHQIGLPLKILQTCA